MAVNVVQLMENYNYEIYQVSRTKGAFGLMTDGGMKLLKEYTKSENRLKFQDYLRNELIANGYDHIDSYVKTDLGELIIKDEEERKFILKNWFEGRECDIYNEDEVVVATKELAKLHIALKKIEIPEEYNFIDQQNCLYNTFSRRTKELKKSLTYIRKKHVKNDFEMLLGNKLGEFIEDAYLAMKYLEEIGADTESVCNTLCHGDYNYHNILFDREFVAITDFDSVVYDKQVADLYNFMRKVLEKNNWDLVLGKKMYNIYNENNCIEEDDKKLLIGMFLFPEKLWKVVNAYYNKKKTLMPQKNIEKLNMCIQQRNLKNSFAIQLLHL